MPTQTETEDNVSISSVVYNLAGPDDGRTNFLKSLVLGAVQREAPIADALQVGYLKGPGIRYRQFGHFAGTNPEFTQSFGLTAGKLAEIPSVPLEQVRGQVPAEPGQIIDSVERAEIHSGQIHFWVLQIMAEIYPDLPPLRPEPFTGPGTYRLSHTGTNYLVTIQLPAPVGGSMTFVPADYNPSAKYLYIRYTPAFPSHAAAIIPGALLTLAAGDPDPVFEAPWVLQGTPTSSSYTESLPYQDTVDVTYSDNRPAEHTVNDPVSVSYTMPVSYAHYVSDTYGGVDTNGLKYTLRAHREFTKSYETATETTVTVTTEVITGGVTRTTTITRVRQYLRAVRQVQISTQRIYWKTELSPRWFIYRYQTGKPVLDGLMAEAIQDSVGAFYPPIPFRYDNKTIGLRNKIATRWRVRLGNLGFDDWDEDSYDAYVSNDYDVQVAKTLDASSDSYVSLKPIDLPTGTAGDWFVESRDPNHPLYRVFSEATVESPCVFRIRTRPDNDEPWTIFKAPAYFSIPPTPTMDGISEQLEDLYPVVKKAFKKAYGAEYDTVMESLLANENISNIDYAYAVFGVSLNVKENACKKYVYKFLTHLLAQGVTPDEADAWMASYQQAHQSRVVWSQWDQRDDDSTEPVRIPYPQIPWKVLSIESVHAGVSDYRTQLRWAFIDENTGSGLLSKSDGSHAQPGELFFTVNADPVAIEEDDDSVFYTPDEYKQLQNQVTLNWQVSATQWKQLVITGLCFTNWIYGQYSVTYTAKESLTWTKRVPNEEGELVSTGEYQEAPFIVPLHTQVFREMPLTDATQMATACTFMVLNCYEEREEPWYSSTWFKVVVIVVAVVIAVVAAVFTGGTSLGIAGAAANGFAVSTLGASATLGIIIGTLADIAVSTAVSYLITYLSTLLFGEKVGTIVGGLLSLLAGGFLSGALDLDSLKQLLSSAQGWISLSMAVTDATTSYLQISAMETQKEMAKMWAQTSREMARIQALMDELQNKTQIDLAAVSKYIDEALEKPEMFLSRTLMTGSDIVEGTLRQVDTFAEDRLQLALP